MSEQTNDNEAELLRQAAAGDAQALNALWESYQDRLLRTIRLRIDRRLQARLDPADVLQEAFLDLSRRLDDFAKDPDVPPYIWVRFLVLQRLQAIHRFHLGAQLRDVDREVHLRSGPSPQASSMCLAEQFLGDFTSPSEALQQAERKRLLQEAIEQLAPHDCEILALRHFEDLSNAETAQVLEISESSASTRHVRALKRLRTLLQAWPQFFEKEAT